MDMVKESIIQMHTIGLYLKIGMDITVTITMVTVTILDGAMIMDGK